MRSLLVACALLLPGTTLAASLKPMTMLNAPVVRLSDLFEDAGTGADRVLGPAPPPGSRIVVEAPQLAAIARQFGVLWKPTSTGDRAILERPGRPVPSADIHAALRDALRGAGAPEDMELDIPTLSPPMVPLNTPARPDVTQLAYDGASGQFAATLVVAAPDMPPAHMRITGRAHEMLPVTVPARRVMPGETLRVDDMRAARIRADMLRGNVARAATDVAGLTPRRPIAAGQPVLLADLARPALVQKGRPVKLRLDSPGIALTAQGHALEDGAAGERIRVLNTTTRSILEAIVLAADTVRVQPDSAPMPADAATMARVR